MSINLKQKGSSMGVFIELFHGRHYSEEKLDDWGFEGPVIGPFPFVHITYGSDIKTDEHIVVANNHFEFPSWDKNDDIFFLGAYYGDMSVFSEELLLQEEKKLLAERVTHTKEVFAVKELDLAKYINDPCEWVRHYVSISLKGLI